MKTIVTDSLTETSKYSLDLYKILKQIHLLWSNNKIKRNKLLLFSVVKKFKKKVNIKQNKTTKHVTRQLGME